MLLRRNGLDTPDGYRRAKDTERADMTLNGEKYVLIKPSTPEDDGLFDGGDVGDEYYRKTFGRQVNNKTSSSQGHANQQLRDAESQASKSEKREDSTAHSSAEQRKKETDTTAENSFNNKVGKIDLNRKSKKGILKKGGPLVAIIALFCGIGGMSTLGVATMPISLMNNLIGKFDSIGVSNNIRTKSFLRFQTSTSSRVGADGDVNNYVKKHAKLYSVFTGDPQGYFKISKRQEAKLAKQGITVADSADGYQVLKFTDSSGTEMTIVADPDLADTSKNTFYFDDAYQNHPEFQESYFNGAKTWRGAVGAWFDAKTEALLGFLGLKRSNLNDFHKKSDSADGVESAKADLQDTVKNTVGDDGINAKVKAEQPEEETVEKPVDPNDPSKGTTSETNPVQNEESGGVKTNTEETEIKGKTKAEISDGVSSSVKSKIDAVTAKMKQGVTFGCLISDVIGGISTIALIYQLAEVIKTASVFFEGIQKSQVEDSSVSPINEIGVLLTTTRQTSYELADLTNTKSNIITDDYFPEDAKVETKTVEVEKSAMEAASVAGLYGGYIPSSNNAGIQSFSLSKWVLGITKTFGLSMTSYKSCAYAKLALATVEAVDEIKTVANLAACAFTFGVTCFAELFEGAGKIIKQTLWSIAQSVIIQVLSSVMISFFGNILARSLATKAFGEELGNALVNGASAYMGRNHLYTGGAVANKESYIAYLNEQDIVLADKARYERATRNPFDTSSQYTFLGSIYQKLIPVTAQSSSIIGKTTNLLKTTSSALSSIIPGASAYSNAVTADQIAEYTEENCTDIASIGGLADEFCNPYIITDVSTTSEDPARVIYNVSKYGGFTDAEGDVPTINKESRLAKYIEYCNERRSPFGIVDQNISNSVQPGTTGSSIGDNILGVVPVVGSVIDGINASASIDNFAYINGEACVINNDNAAVAVPNWEEAKEYQRFIEDQRLSESMGIIEKSSVTAFLEEYYAENPLDNSYEGILARYTGMTKENVIATLELIDTIEFLADYDPTGRGPLESIEAEANDDDVSFNFIRSTSIIQERLLGNDHTYYEERRIRNFALA